MKPAHQAGPEPDTFPLLVQIPEFLSPGERETRFAGPLAAALAGGLGRVTGGESELLIGAETENVGSEVAVEVSDLKRGLAIIREVLVGARAPAGTVVLLADAGLDVLAFGSGGATTSVPLPEPGRPRRPCPWEEGELVGYVLPSRRQVVFHALSNALVPSIRVLDWVGTEMPAELQLRDLVATPPTHKDLSRILLISRHRANEIPGGRIHPTGLVISPQVSLDLIDQFIGVRNWAELDTFLGRVCVVPSPPKRLPRRRSPHVEE